MAGPRPTFDRDHYKKDTLNVDKNDNGRVVKDKVADNDDDQGESNNQNSDRDYKEKQRELGHFKKGFFLDKTWSSTLVTPEKALLDTLGDVKPGTVTSDTGKKLT